MILHKEAVRNGLKDDAFDDIFIMIEKPIHLEICFPQKIGKTGSNYPRIVLQDERLRQMSLDPLEIILYQFKYKGDSYTNIFIMRRVDMKVVPLAQLYEQKNDYNAHRRKLARIKS